MQRLLSQLLSAESHSFWRSHVFILQLLQEVAVVAQGRLLSLTALAAADLAAHELPRTTSRWDRCAWWRVRPQSCRCRG